MDSELLYLNKRVNFHRRMAKLAVDQGARCAHDAFVSAYRVRMEELTRCETPAVPAGKRDHIRTDRPILSIAIAD